MGSLLDCISGALTMIGQLGSGQSASPEDGALGLREANLMIKQASTSRLMLFYVASRQYAFLLNTRDYTLGPTGTIAAVRPTFIESCQVNVALSNVWLPISMWDKRQFDSIINRGATADIPEGVYVEYSYPNIGLHFNPAPGSITNFRIGTWEPLTQFPDVFTQIGGAYPDEYEEWIQATLAIRLAPSYDQPVPQNLMQRAAEAAQAVMQKNGQGLGGALSQNARMDSPNLGQPLPSAPVGA